MKETRRQVWLIGTYGTGDTIELWTLVIRAPLLVQIRLTGTCILSGTNSGLLLISIILQLVKLKLVLNWGKISLQN